MQMRTTKPTKGNKYYIRKSSGGYSPCIKGKPTDTYCDVLSNCVGYALGRFNEIGGYGYCKYLKSVNAENFIANRGSLSYGQTPKVGACMVWEGKGSLAGHVAIVEKVYSSTKVYTSESGYGGSAFWNSTRNKNSNGNWGSNTTKYKFLGFIYNPAVNDITPSVSRDIYKNQLEIKTTMNIRKGAGTNNESLGTVSKGIYNWFEIKNNGGYNWYRIADNQWVAQDVNNTYLIIYNAQPKPTPAPTPTPTPTIDLLLLVKKTIRGDFGNGATRRKKLGDNYAEVQKQVNLNLKNGLTRWDNIKLF